MTRLAFGLVLLALSPRPASAEARPNLVAAAVDRSSVASDCVSGDDSGNVLIEIQNSGVASSGKPVRVYLFEDINHDGAYTHEVDALLADLLLPSLAPLKSATLTADISTRLSFAGAPLAVIVDPMNAVVEETESDNVVSSSSSSGPLPLLSVGTPGSHHQEERTFPGHAGDRGRSSN